MVNYHPAPELLADYASGSMTLSHSLCVATHLEFCSHCRQHVKKLTQLGAHYFELQNVRVEDEQENEKLKGKVLGLLDEFDERSEDEVSHSQSVDFPVTTSSVTGDSVPAAKSLGQFVKGGFNDLAWSRVTPSIKLATLLHDKDGSQIALSRTAPGGKMPHHSHTGDEITVVLEGSFSDEKGVYCQGDFIFRDARDKHTPVVTRDAECICLMVLDAPIQFTGFFTRLLNPLVRKHHINS